MKNHPHRLVRWLLLRLFPVRVDDLHHVPDQGPAILAFVHHSPLDGVYIWALSKRPIVFIVIWEAFLQPVIGRCLAWTGQIPVVQNNRYAREDPYSGAMALKEAERALEHGALVGIAPEGYVGDPGRVRPLKPGVIRLALATGAPVIPVGIIGSDRAMRNLKELPRPFRRIHLVYGAPIHTKGRSNTPTDRQWLRETIAQQLAELSGQQPCERRSQSSG